MRGALKGQNCSNMESLLLEPSIPINKKKEFNLIIDDLVIETGSLNFVIGKVGCGKTALLLSMLNEMTYENLEE